MVQQKDERAPLADAYQARYMGGDALYHDKSRVPSGFYLLLLSLVVVSFVGSVIALRAPVAAQLLLHMIPATVLLTSWAFFSVLRTSVSRDQVYVQRGVFGPRIPVRDIERCDAVDYDWKQHLGWEGIGRGRDGSVAYTMVGCSRAVKIVFREGSKLTTMLVASPDPVRLAAAIQHARAAAVGGPSRPRVDAPVAEEALLEQAVEEEAATTEGEAGEVWGEPRR
jgi:hypothetical protein